MSEERNEMIEEMVELEEVYDYEEPEEERGGLIKTVAVAGGTLIVGGATAFAIKKRDKIAAKLEERKVRKLEAKGYIIERPEFPEEIDESDSNEELESEK